MFRKFAGAALIAAFTFADTVAQACTGISLDAKDGAMIRGRTMESARGCSAISHPSMS